MPAIVAAVLWAVLAGMAASVLLAAIVFALIAVAKPAAATRHALWIVALVVPAIAPPVIIATMTVRGLIAPVELPLRATPPLAARAVSAAASPALAQRPDSQDAASGARSRIVALARLPQLPARVANGLGAAWLLGAVVGLIGLARSVIRVRGLKRRSSPLEGRLADDLPWLTERRGREIYLRLSYELETPIAVGFSRPVILIPTDMATEDGLTSIEPLVMHEYAHLTRYDDWTNVVQRAIERVYWFNPVVWAVGRRIALEREVAADEAVVERTHDAHDYAARLWRLAREMRMPEHVVVAPGAMLTRKQISVRIERLLDGSARPHLEVAALSLVFVAACGVAAIAAAAPPLVLPIAGGAAKTVAVVPLPSPPAQPKARPHTSAPETHAHAPRPPQASSAIDVHIAARTVHVPAVDVHLPAIDIHVPVPPTPPAIIANATKYRLPAPGGPLTREIVAGCVPCDFSNADLSGLDLHGLDLAGDTFAEADLAHANLSGARLTASNMRDVNLRDADLHGARLAGTNLRNADLHDANLRGSTLLGVTLEGADLNHADLRGATLTGVNLSGTDLTGADTSGASLTGTALPRGDGDTP